jgi:hypothetical protein
MKIIADYSENHTKHINALMRAERKILWLNLKAQINHEALKGYHFPSPFSALQVNVCQQVTSVKF